MRLGGSRILGNHPTVYPRCDRHVFSTYVHLINMENNGSSRAEGAGRGTRPCSHRILVVDDDGDIRRLNSEALAGSGYHVDAAEDGAVGWEALNANSYDLLITDHDMPKLSGIDLIKKLRSARMGVPVILSSGVISGEKLEPPLVAALPKPFTLDQLLGTVRQVLRATESDRESWDLSQIRPGLPSADGYRL